MPLLTGPARSNGAFPEVATDGSDIASAATLNFTTATTAATFHNITGTTGITAVTMVSGRVVQAKFAGAVTLTHSSNLILPGGVNFTTAANDVLTFKGEAGGVVRVIAISKADGTPVGLSGAAIVSAIDAELGSTAWRSGGGATVPGAPTIGTATATGATTATVAFTAPASNGGATITGYTATSSPGGITGTLSQAGSGTITVTGLTTDQAYTFTVTATNSAGTSAASSASNSVTPEADLVSHFERGFTMQSAAILAPSTGTRAGQLQELFMLDDPTDVDRLVGFYSALSDGTATTSAIWRCEATKAAPNVLLNHSEIYTAASQAEYVRLTTALYDGANYHFYLTLGGDEVWHGTSATGLGITMDGSPCLAADDVAMECNTTNASPTVTTADTSLLSATMTVTGAGIPGGTTILSVDDATTITLSANATATATTTLTFGAAIPVSLFSVMKDGANWYGCYATNAATPEAAYHTATSSDGTTWVKDNNTVLTPEATGSDSGGLEFSSLRKVGSDFVIFYEAWNGLDHWGCHVAHATTITGPFTKLGAVLTHDAGSAFAQVHVATPTLHKINGRWTAYFQGSNVSSPPTGGGGPWSLGYATLNLP